MVAVTRPEPAASQDVARAMLYAAIAVAQGHARSVEKDAQNTFHRYKYASAEAIIAEAKESLAHACLGIVRLSSRVERLEKALGERAAEGGKKGMEGAVAVLHAGWLIVHGAGGSLEMTVEWPIVPESGRPIDKAVAAAHTASLGYLLRDLLQLPRVEEGTALDGDGRDEARRAEEEEAKRVEERKRKMEEDKRRAMGSAQKPPPAAPPAASADDEMRVKTAVLAELDRHKIGAGLPAPEKKKAQIAEVARINGGKPPDEVAGWRTVLDKLKAEPLKAVA
jgi:hypothetical protein